MPSELNGKPAPSDAEHGDGLSEWKHLYALTPAQVFPRGVELFRQGTATREVFYVNSGIVKLVHANSEGQERILDLAFTGAWLGSAAAIADVPNPVTGLTCTEATFQRIPANVFRDLLEQIPELSRNIREMHARELCNLTVWMAQLSSRTSRERLEAVIRQLILALGLTASARGIRLQVPLRHWEIAALVAVSPEHLSRLLKQMEAEGVIKREKDWVIVPDLSRLCAACEDSSRWCEYATTLNHTW